MSKYRAVQKRETFVPAFKPQICSHQTSRDTVYKVLLKYFIPEKLLLLIAESLCCLEQPLNTDNCSQRLKLQKLHKTDLIQCCQSLYKAALQCQFSSSNASSLFGPLPPSLPPLFLSLHNDHDPTCRASPSLPPAPGRLVVSLICLSLQLIGTTRHSLIVLNAKGRRKLVISHCTKLLRASM